MNVFEVGFIRVKKRLEIDPVEAETVQLIDKPYLQVMAAPAENSIHWCEGRDRVG